MVALYDQFRTAMTNQPDTRCVLLADRHSLIVEGVRDMLRTEFNALYIVGDECSLLDGAQRLHPTVIVLDLSISEGNTVILLHALRQLSTACNLIGLTLHDQPSAAQTILNAGANAVVLKRCIAGDLLAAIDAVRQGRQYVSPDIGAGLA